MTSKGQLQNLTSGQGQEVTLAGHAAFNLMRLDGRQVTTGLLRTKETFHYRHLTTYYEASESAPGALSSNTRASGPVKFRSTPQQVGAV